MDTMVLRTQEWLNETYGSRAGYDIIPEDGRTGNTTVTALIKALQIELGIYPTSPTFGPETTRRFPELSIQEIPILPPYPTDNLVFILQGAFWCKGYSPGSLSGFFDSYTERAVKRFQEDVGFISQNGVVNAKLMKAILNTDGFIMQGRPNVRTIQQVLNRQYSTYFDYIPTNGVYDRKTNTALIYALQDELGLGTIANGNYGPSTIANTITLRPNNTHINLNRILQFALVCNGEEYDTFNYNGVYSSQVAAAVSKFQNFMTLPATGVADMPTIKQLLTSNGYTGRSAIVCDASTIIDGAKAQTLVQNGYEIVGRYLTGNVGIGNGQVRSKAMTAEELSIITKHGLKVFPIYQDGGYYLSYFVEGKGITDAFKAVNAAEKLGFPTGTTIYFAVDFDAYDFQVSDNILPYLAEVRTILNGFKDNNNTPKYKLGVYGARNTCIRAMNTSTVKADYSFVGNMSTGFSGNLGFPMPLNWSFNQFFETTIGTGNGTIGIDKNDYSGRDRGVANLVNPILPDLSEEDQTLYDEMIELGKHIPGFLSDPKIFNGTFIFSKKYTVFNQKPLTIDIEVKTTTITPGNTKNSVVAEVSNGKLKDISLRQLLGDVYGDLSPSRVNSYEENVRKLTARIGNGWIEFSSNNIATEHTMTLTAYKSTVPFENGGSGELAIYVTYTVETDTLSPIYNPLLELSAVALLLGVGLAIFEILKTLRNPVILIATFVSFIMGSTDNLFEDD